LYLLHRALPSFPTRRSSDLRLNDIAFSGDGEPTTCPVFEQAVDVALKLRAEIAPPETKLVLISDSACFDRSGVIAGIKKMMQVPDRKSTRLNSSHSQISYAV